VEWLCRATLFGAEAALRSALGPAIAHYLDDSPVAEMMLEVETDRPKLDFLARPFEEVTVLS